MNSNNENNEWKLTLPEMIDYHYNIYYNRKEADLKGLRSYTELIQRGCLLNDNQLQNLISIISVNMEPSYVIQEVRAILKGKRINKLECEVNRSYERDIYEIRRRGNRDFIPKAEITVSREAD